MVVCLTSARFNMKADILRQITGESEEIDETGEWVFIQDPDSGEIIRKWQPKNPLPDDPGTTGDESEPLESFSLAARSIIDGGIRVQGNTENWNPEYEKVGYLRIWFPASVRLSERDRVTNVRDKKGNVIWKERQIPGLPPTVYEVTGITEIVDPFGRHIESMALLQRAERQ